MSRTLVAVEELVITDRRQKKRHKVGCDALVTVFGTDEQVLQGTLTNVAENGTQITLDQPVAPSSLVKIEYADSFLLGEVVYCQADHSHWLVGVRIEHGLFGLTSLAAAIRKSWT